MPFYNLPFGGRLLCRVGTTDIFSSLQGGYICSEAKDTGAKEPALEVLCSVQLQIQWSGKTLEAIRGRSDANCGQE